MLTIQLKVNDKEVKRIDVINVHPCLVENNFEGECPYQIFTDKDGLGVEIGFVSHKRSDGVVALADKVLNKLRWDELRIGS